MISRSAGQGADHVGTAETGDVNGAGDSARGEEDHVYGTGDQTGRSAGTRRCLNKDLELLKTMAQSGQSCKRCHIVVLGDADRGGLREGKQKRRDLGQKEIIGNSRVTRIAAGDFGSSARL